jgi:hypothetical protein
MDPAESHDLLDRELKRLPAPRAPETLLPRVMAATVERRPVRATGWLTWPMSWQAASVALVGLVAYAGWLFFSAPPGGVGQAARTAGETATLVRVIWDVLLQPVFTYIVILGVSLALVSAAAWAALEVALGGATQR